MKYGNKNILLYMTDFYGYNNDIINEIKRQGWNVTWYQDKVKFNICERMLSKVYNGQKKKKFMNYFIKVLEKEKNQKFDLILIIFGATFMNGKHIDLLKTIFPQTPIVYYAWDSVENFPSIRSLFEHADVAYSFDKNDCQQYGVNFLPLFYVVKDDFKKNINYEWDVSTVMSFYNKKSASLLSVLDVLPDQISKNLFIRFRDKIYSLYMNIVNRSTYLKIKKYVRYDSLSREECIDLFRKSRAVIDCPLPNQNGLTMRTFEALALNRKLITTNKNIKKYDFYSPDNIYVVNKKEKIPINFFNTSFNKEYEIKEVYGIENFVKTLTQIYH